MKDKQMIVLVDDEFLGKVEYIQRVNDYKSKSETIRKTIEKEYRKENMIPLDEFVIKEEDKVIPVEGLGDVMPFKLGCSFKERERERLSEIKEGF